MSKDHEEHNGVEFVGIGPKPDGSAAEIISVWVFTDKNTGDLIGIQLPGAWFPMITADHTILQQYRRLVRKIVNRSGKPAKLIEFRERCELEVIEPDLRN